MPTSVWTGAGWQLTGASSKPRSAEGGSGEEEATDANPTDRAKLGTKRPLGTEATGVPIACLVTGANRTEMKKLADLLAAIRVPRPALDESHLTLDRGDDYDACREAAVSRG